MKADNAQSTRWIETWFACLVPFLGWWYYGLFDLDEGFYGAVVGEMNRRHEWITPYFNGSPWFEKPILLYWLAKPCVQWFGVMFGPRLPSVLATFGLLFVMARFAKRHLSAASAQYSILIYAGSLLPVLLGRMMMVDALLVLCLAGSLLAFWESLDNRAAFWRLISGLCLGASVLAKGPVGIILFTAILGWTFYRESELRPNFKGGWLGFAAGLTASISTWYVPAYLANPTAFVQEFLIKQNLQRFVGGDQAHNAGLVGLPLYIIVLLLGMCPWTFYLLKNWPRRTTSTPLQRFLVSWATIIFVFFTISGTKLPHYVLPCCPPIALFVGDLLARRYSENTGLLAKLPDRFGAIAAILACTLVAHFGAFTYYKTDHAEVHAIAAYVNSQPQPNVVAYQMPRREAALGTLGPKVQETSHPSLLLYLNRPVAEVEKFEDLLKVQEPCWIVTRSNRISAEDVERAANMGMSLSHQMMNGENLYSLYLLRKGDPKGQQPQVHKQVL